MKAQLWRSSTNEGKAWIYLGGTVTILLAGSCGGDSDPVHVLDLTREGPGHQLVLFHQSHLSKVRSLHIDLV